MKAILPSPCSYVLVGYYSPWSRAELMQEESNLRKEVNQDLHDDLPEMNKRYLENNRAWQPLTYPYKEGVYGETSLAWHHLYEDFHSPKMFQYIDIKTVLHNIFDRARQQSLNASLALDQSIERKIKGTIDFVLGIHNQKTIRDKGIDMDILWCIVNALAEECNGARLSLAPHIYPTAYTRMCSRDMHTRIKPVQRSPFLKDLGTEGVNFGFTNSSLQKGADASVRIQWHAIHEVETSFCSSPLFLFDSGACWTGGLNPLPGLDRVDVVSVANEHQDFFDDVGKYLCLVRRLLSMTKMKKTRQGRLRKIIRHNKGRRVVSRRCLAHKSRDHKRHEPPRKTRGMVSRSADKSGLPTADNTPDRTWRVASAAPQHMTGYLNHLTDYTPALGDKVIDTPTMGHMVFHGSGSVNTKNMILGDVLYVPGLEASLVSTGQLAELGYTISIGPYGCRVYKDDEGMDLVGKAHYVDGYLLELDFLRV